MALLCKTGRPWWSLRGFPALLCDGRIVQCCNSLGRLCGLSGVLWVTWVPSDAPVQCTHGLAPICSWLPSGGTGSKVLPVGWLPGSSVPLQPLCTVTVWKVPHISMDLFSPLEHTHSTQTKLCFTFSASKRWRSSKSISLIQTAVVAVPESLTRGFIPACPQLLCSEVVVYSSRILLMI